MVTDIFNAFFGGLMIGVAALLLLIGCGRIAGYSGIISLAVLKKGPVWRWFFIIGTFMGGGLMLFISKQHLPSIPLRPELIIAGLLVGFGARLGNGCTSGHGICGIGRLSVRSLVATGVFMVTGILTAILFH